MRAQNEEYRSAKADMHVLMEIRGAIVKHDVGDGLDQVSADEWFRKRLYDVVMRSRKLVDLSLIVELFRFRCSQLYMAPFSHAFSINAVMRCATTAAFKYAEHRVRSRRVRRY